MLLVALVPLLGAAGGCGAGAGDGLGPPAKAAGPAVDVVVPAAAPPVRPAPEPAIDRRPPPRGSTRATVLLLRATTLRSRPGGPVLARLGTRTAFGSPVVLAVVRRRAGWLGVLHPRAGNGRLGWIAARGTRAYRTAWSIAVSLRRREAVVRRRGRVVWRFPVAVGAPATPTPTGRFAVTDRLRFRRPGVYGCCALALTARQPRIAQGWGGGDRIAVHGTPAVGTVGAAVSHGCLRAHAQDVRRLVARVPLGSPVTIAA